MEVNKEIKKNRTFILAGLILILTFLFVGVGGFLVFNLGKWNALALENYNYNVNLHNELFTSSEQEYDKVIDLTRDLTIEFRASENFSGQIEAFRNSQILLNEEKNKIQETNQKITLGVENLKYEPSQEIANLADKTKLALEKYSESNTALIVYIDFYSCQIDNIVREIELDNQIQEITQKVQTTANPVEVVEEFKKLEAVTAELESVYNKYEICYNEDSNQFKPEELTQATIDIVGANQEMVDVLKSLSKAAELQNPNQLSKAGESYDVIAEKINLQLQTFRNLLRQSLNKFDENIQNSNQSSYEANEAVYQQSITVKNRYGWR